MRSASTRPTRRPVAALTALTVVLGGVVIATAGPHRFTGSAAAEQDGRAGPHPDLRIHAQYADSLRLAGDAGPEAAAWLVAAERAFDAAVTIEPPYVERGHLPAESPDALGYRLTLRAGERLRMELRQHEGRQSLLLDLFAGTGAGADAGGEALATSEDVREWVPILPSATASPRIVEYEAMRDGDLVVRLQPPPGLGARYTLTITRTAALTFPVAGASASDVVGHFFDPRDGGARPHRGIDIVARRGTPVLAVADGRVDRVEETEVGGLVVWLAEERSERLHYYAHLDRQLVVPGQRVRAGQQIGTVGSTGNAAGGTPHLHFGIYRDGIGINPIGFLSARDFETTDGGHVDNVAVDLVGDVAIFDPWPEEAAGEARAVEPRVRVRTAVAGVALRGRNVATGARIALERHAELEVLAMAGRLLRVRLPDGREGFIARTLVEPLNRP